MARKNRLSDDDNIEKQKKKEPEFSFDEDTPEFIGVPPLSTGVTLLDLLLSDTLPGGVPLGRILHIYGAESTAKTAFALSLAYSAQQKKGKVYCLDAEWALDKVWGRRVFRIRTSKQNSSFWYLGHPSSIEDLWDNYVYGILNEKPPLNSIVVVDSLTALPSVDEVENSLDDTGYGTVRAKRIGAGFRKYNSKISKVGLIFVFIDQARTDVAKMFGSKMTVSGGKALKFYSSIRLQLDKVETIKNKMDKVIGSTIKVTSVKNKTSSQQRTVEIDFLFDYGFDDITSNLKFLQNERSVKSFAGAKGVFSFPNCEPVIGLPKAVEFVEQNNLEDVLRDEVRKVWKTVYAPIERKQRIIYI